MTAPSDAWYEADEDDSDRFPPSREEVMQEHLTEQRTDTRPA
jgi:hypothetical protein